jgi:hypothetical protein
MWPTSSPFSTTADALDAGPTIFQPVRSRPLKSSRHGGVESALSAEMAVAKKRTRRRVRGIMGNEER